jgi:hypothetical protein
LQQLYSNSITRFETGRHFLLSLINSDPFWYEADGYLTPDEEKAVRATTLSQLITRNTNIRPNEIQCFSMTLPDGCGRKYSFGCLTVKEPVSPPQGVSYDYLVTLQKKTPANPLFGLENDFSFAINGIDGGTIVVERGRTYTFFAQRKRITLCC